MKLGRKKPLAQYDHGKFLAVVGQDGKTRFFPKLARHYKAGPSSPPIPPTCDWGAKAKSVIARMYLNDQYGDCVLASRHHGVGIQTGNDTPVAVQATDGEVYADYQSACGPGDNGCDMSAVNEYQRTRGLTLSGINHKIEGSVAVDPKNKEMVKAAIFLFGNLNIGIDLPESWYNSADNSDWGMTNSGIVGGHEIQGFGYNERGVLISTWGGERTILWDAFTSGRYVNELYTSLSKDWYNDDNHAPNGVNVETLRADLAAIGGGTIPPVDPNPPSPPVVPPVVPPVPPTPTPQAYAFVGDPIQVGGLFHRTVTPTGKIVPIKNVKSFNLAWLKILGDVESLLTHAFTLDVSSIKQSVTNLVRHIRDGDLTSVVTVDLSDLLKKLDDGVWSQVWPDVLQILSDLGFGGRVRVHKSCAGNVGFDWSPVIAAAVMAALQAWLQQQPH